METEQKHTLGPCSIKEFACTQFLVIGPESNEPQPCVLASCEGADRLGNATLFAAAPELLAACRRVAQTLGLGVIGLEDHEETTVDVRWLRNMRTDLRAAIPKTTH